MDTHVHHSACMHQKHLLRFIKSKLRKEPDEVVIFRDGKYLTLMEVFESLNLTGYGTPQGPSESQTLHWLTATVVCLVTRPELKCHCSETSWSTQARAIANARALMRDSQAPLQGKA